jgi:prepilin-type processing-associated H-X9-DG protein
MGIGGSISALNAPASTVLLFEIASLNQKSGCTSDFCYDDADLSTVNEVGSQFVFMGSPSSIYSTTGTGTICQNHFSAFVPIATGYIGGQDRLAFWSGYTFLGSAGRHSGGANYLACDGHVKWLTGKAVSTGYYYTFNGPAPSPSFGTAVVSTPTTHEDPSPGSVYTGGPYPQGGQAAGTEAGQGFTLTFSPV